MEALNSENELNNVEKENSVSNSANKILALALQSKSALRNVLTVNKHRKRVSMFAETTNSITENESYSKINHHLKSSPNDQSIRSLHHPNYSQALSSSKIVRSVSTPEINLKFIFPTPASTLKTNIHRRINFSTNQQKENNFLNMHDDSFSQTSERNQVNFGGIHSKKSSSTLSLNNTREISQSDSFFSHELNKSTIITAMPYQCDAECSITKATSLIEDSANGLPSMMRHTPKKESHANKLHEINGTLNNQVLLSSEVKLKPKDANSKSYFPKVLTTSKKPTKMILSPESTDLLTFSNHKNSLPSFKPVIVPQYKSSPIPSTVLQSSNIIKVNGLNYLILHELGRGGSSVVYQVVDLQKQVNKAIKVISLDEADDFIITNFRQEIAILQRLQYSPRIVKLYDYEETTNQMKLVMEAGSMDLAEILSSARRNKVPIPPFSIKHYWQAMLFSVQVIHQEGIIHSDLKPANFLVVKDVLKLIDFGIASSIQPNMTSVFKEVQGGTYNYMSPESLNHISLVPTSGHLENDTATIKINVKSDVWSLGCILYNLVYGKTPFQHLVRPLEKLSAIANPATVIVFPPVTDKHLLDVMQTCLQFDPYKRPSIKELLCHPYLDGPLIPKAQCPNSNA